MQPAPSLRRPLGVALLVAATIVGLGAIVGTAVAWIAIGDAQRSSRHALELADEALVSVDSSLAVASDVMAEVRAGVGAMSGGLSDVADALDAGDAALGQVQQLVDALPSSLQGVVGAMHTLSGVADGIDQTLTVISQAPLIPDYRPATSLGDLVRQVEASLAPLVANTQGISGDFDQARASASNARARVRTLAANVGAVDAALARASEQLATYRTTAAEARTLARSARSDLDRDLTILRAIALPLGLALAVAQLLPLWFGAALLWPDERRLVTSIDVPTPEGARREPVP